MRQPDFKGAVQYALGRLERELSPRLCYHSLGHTRDDVVPATERLAAMEPVDGEQLLLLRTAAYYHDLGFVEQRSDHEQIAVDIVNQVLPGFGYTAPQIHTIAGIILVTQFPQSPTTLLQEIMADADLDVLGREDFLPRSYALRDELAAFGEFIPIEEWYRRQHQFLQSHRYFTASARKLRDARKQQNIEHLAALLRQVQD